MISYHDWQIESSGLLARQFDNLSRRLEVVGDLPEGWNWSMLVQLGDTMDIIPLDLMDGGVGHTLTEDQLSLSGYYAMQLRGTKGNVTRHTNIIHVFVAESLSGSGQWPCVPSEFLEVERHIAELNAHPPVPGKNGFWLIWNSDANAYEESQFSLPDGTFVKIDTTLTAEGSAADAKAAGDAIRQLSENKLGKDELNSAINTALTQAKQSGEFDGPAGPAYELTVTDKQEIVSDVLSALPTYNGEVETV